MLLSWSAWAVTINLTSDKTELKVNETITFHLEVRDAGYMGGAFTVRRLNEDNIWQNVRQSFSSSCTMCRGGRDMGDLKEDPSFIPLLPGVYRADATYGGMNKTIEFTVYPLTTTSSTTITTSTTKRTTTTTTSSSTTTTTEPPTSTTTTSTSSTSSTTQPQQRSPSSAILLYIFGIGLIAMILILIYARK